MVMDFKIFGNKKSEIIRYIRYSIALLLLSVIHLTFLDLISVGGLTPDLILILCVWIALKEGRFVGISAAFICGIFFDIVSLDVIGMNALSKTLAAFFAGSFYREGHSDEIIGSFLFLIIVLSSALLNNLVYFFFYLKPSEATLITFFLKYGLASALYTTLLAIFPLFVKIPKKGYRPI